MRLQSIEVHPLSYVVEEGMTRSVFIPAASTRSDQVRWEWDVLEDGYNFAAVVGERLLSSGTFVRVGLFEGKAN